jgi:hypothetical protein
MLTVPIGKPRRRSVRRLTARLDQRADGVSTSGDSRVDVAKDRGKALVLLFLASNCWQERVTKAPKELQFSPLSIYREAGYRCRARTAASRWESTIRRLRRILLRGGGEQA